MTFTQYLALEKRRHHGISIVLVIIDILCISGYEIKFSRQSNSLFTKTTSKTRMYSSRVRTARSSSHWVGEGGFPPGTTPREQAPPGPGTPKEHTPPETRHSLGADTPQTRPPQTSCPPGPGNPSPPCEQKPPGNRHPPGPGTPWEQTPPSGTR